MKRTEHREAQWAFPFVEYCPADSCGKLPLILQLHGAGERGDGQAYLSAVDVNGFSALLSEHDYPCRVILPQCPENSFWAARVESILKFIRQLTEHYAVDENRIYLTGLSMGGYGTWFTATAAPELFAAIAPVCGGGMAWAADVLKMPIWAFHGIDDPIVNVRNSDEMVESLQNCGADITYTRLENVGHNAWDYAYNETLLQWLLSHHK